MAIALVQSKSGTIDTGDSLVVTCDANVAAGNLVLVAVAQRDESKAITVSGLGATWTEIANVDNTQGQGGISLWRCSNANGSTAAVTVTVTGSTVPTCVVVAEFSGVDVATTDGIEASATTAGPGTDDNDMLLAVTTVTDNAWAVAAGWGRGQALTLPGGETAIQINVVTDPGLGNVTRCHLWYQGPVSPAASTQLGALNDLSANGDWAMIVVAVKPSGGGTTYTKAGAAVAAVVTSGADVFEAVKAGMAVCD